jgi:hypothetical protein
MLLLSALAVHASDDMQNGAVFFRLAHP